VSLNWDSISAKDIEHACEQLIAQGKGKKTGLVVSFRGHWLPAKNVLSLAYRRANGLEESVKLKFSSGDATLVRLQKFGFTAERHAPSTEASNAGAAKRL
jgi:hypothetical protein